MQVTSYNYNWCFQRSQGRNPEAKNDKVLSGFASDKPGEPHK